MSLRILSLEDVAYDVELMERELRKASIEYELKRVDTKEEFLAALTEFNPDIILADYHLDNGDCGLSAVATLRANRSVPIPAVVITADHSSEVAGRVNAAGCDILRKPVKPAELRALVTHLVR